MASLSTEVQTRVSSALLIQLTNQGTTGSSLSIVTAVLDAAVADAQAEFYEEVGVTWDSTHTGHIAAGVAGVLYYLHSYVGSGKEATERLRERWDKWLLRLAQSDGAERRILPSSTSVLQESDPTGNPYPDHDRTRWRDFTLNHPGAASVEEDD